MPSVLLADSIAVELGASQPWPDDAKVLQSFEKSQVLLPESTSSLGVQTFLRMAGLDHEVEMRPNVESISPSGNVPVLKCGPFVIAEMDPIVAFVNTKGIQLTQNLSVQQKADIRAYMSLINTVLVNSEVTKPRYGSVYPWPLNHILSFRRRRQILAKLSVSEWSEKSLEEVFEEVQSCCAALSERLGQSNYFFGDKPTELDALTFGHLYCLMTTELVDGRLGQIVSGFSNLVDLCHRVESQYFADS
ncbi:metaxin-2 isoform X2 [Rhipicephalus sanguineus]|uniref:metaxin-2 isoform X2 n=1 Tax=Rhipicephalus sanguineus TaxID=34632 RepID=UPI0020C3314D|nr:metaxin-2 isoform X2 [Rhipicephalus sanguineus]